jgi:hypothetical protein
MNQPSPAKKTLHFIRFIQLDLALATILVLFLSTGSGGEALSKTFVFRLVLMAFLSSITIALFFIQRSSVVATLEQGFSRFEKNTLMQFAPIIIFAVLSGVLIFFPKQSVTFLFFPLLICAWLIGSQFLLFFHGRSANPAIELPLRRLEKTLAIFSIMGIYLFLAMPSRLAGIFDGSPWNSNPEFIFAAIVIPFSFIFGWRIYGKKAFFAIVLFLALSRVSIAFLMPESGLGVRSYQNLEDMQAGKWRQSYTTALGVAYSDIVKAPYREMYEFPADWITRQALATNPNPWIGITIHGYAKLEAGEKLAFLTSGLDHGEITLTGNAGSHSAVIINASQTTDEIVPADFAPGIFSISGQLIFKSGNPYQFAPVILQADGTTRSAFDDNRLWLSDSVFGQPATVVSAIAWFVWLQNIALAGLVIVSLLIGVWAAIQRNGAGPLEIYLGISGALVLTIVSQSWDFLSLFLTRNNWAETLQFSTLFLVLYSTCILLAASSRPENQSKLGKRFLLAIGPIAVTLMLLMYFDHFGQFTIFSTLDDPFEYQHFARNVFIGHDSLLLNDPPRAYKFLFPYIVGLLHLFFGQSSISQVLLNTWCGLLTAVFLIKIAQAAKVQNSIAVAAGGVFVTLLLGNYYFLYFHFGLIEPLAILNLVSFLYFAQKKNFPILIFTGIATILLRLDYAGAVIAGLLLTSAPMPGSFSQAWSQVIHWLKSNWLKIGVQTIILFLPVTTIIVAYNLMIKNYMLNASDTVHTGLVTILEGWTRVIAGGNLAEIKMLFTDGPLVTVLTTLILVAGAITGLAALFWRGWKFYFMDLRWSLVLLGLLSVYLVVRPTGYPPRFSTAMLPLAILMLAFLFDKIWKTH